jgi:hypothetical protein
MSASMVEKEPGPQGDPPITDASTTQPDPEMKKDVHKDVANDKEKPSRAYFMLTNTRHSLVSGL